MKNLCKEEAYKTLKGVIDNGNALERFRKMVEQQGGNPEIIDDYTLLPVSKNKKEMIASNDGWISEINAYDIGMINLFLGGGRNKKEDRINPGVGIVFKKKVGDKVNRGETIATVYFEKSLDNQVEKRFFNAVKISPVPLRKPTTVLTQHHQ